MHQPALRNPEFLLVAGMGGIIGFAISFSSLWFLSQARDRTYCMHACSGLGVHLDLCSMVTAHCHQALPLRALYLCLCCTRASIHRMHSPPCMQSCSVPVEHYRLWVYCGLVVAGLCRQGCSTFACVAPCAACASIHEMPSTTRTQPCYVPIEPCPLPCCNESLNTTYIQSAPVTRAPSTMSCSPADHCHHLLAGGCPEQDPCGHRGPAGVQGADQPQEPGFHHPRPDGRRAVRAGQADEEMKGLQRSWVCPSTAG